MQINLTGHHLEVTPAIKTYVETKLERMERHFDHVTTVHVVLAVEKQRRRAEATINVAGGRLYADVEHDDLYAAIDVLIDKLDRQLIRHKEQLTDHHRADGGLKGQS